VWQGWGWSVALTTALICVACAGDGSGGLPDPDFLLRDAAAASTGVRTAHVDLETSGQVPGLAVRSLDADVVAPRADSPGAAEGTATVTLGNGPVTVRFVEIDGRILVDQGGGRYAPPPSSTEQLPRPSVLLDPDAGLGATLANLQGAQTVVREDVDGTTAFKVTGEVPGDVVARLLPGVAPEETPMSVWFAVEGRHAPVKSELTVADGSGGTTTLTLRLTDANRPVEISAPPT